MTSAKTLILLALSATFLCSLGGCANNDPVDRRSNVKSLSERPVRERIKAVKEFRSDWLNKKASDKKLKEKYGLSEEELKQVKKAVQRRSTPNLPNLVEKKEPRAIEPPTESPAEP